MDEVIRALSVYATMMLIFRLSGKRTFAEMTSFDFVLLLFFSEALQEALVDNDSSMTAAFTVILTLVMVNIALSLLKERSAWLERLVEGVPIILVENGKLLKDRMARARVDEGDILAAARQSQGIEDLDQIKRAVLERSGGISIIPVQAAG